MCCKNTGAKMCKQKIVIVDDLYSETTEAQEQELIKWYDKDIKPYILPCFSCKVKETE